MLSRLGRDRKEIDAPRVLRLDLSLTHSNFGQSRAQQRLAYAAAIEKVADHASQFARIRLENDRKQAEEFFKIAIENYNKANTIRDSALTVDPANGECRCIVASNYSKLGEVYRQGFGFAEGAAVAC